MAFVLLGTALRGHGARAGAVLGLLAGLGFFVPLLSWTGEFVGPVPWLALSVLQALFVAAVGAGIGALATRWWWPPAAAAVWTAGEAVRGRVPFGGFPWGRVGFGQADGPFISVAALGGVPLLGFVVVLSGFAVVEIFVETRQLRAPPPHPIAVALVAVGLVLVAPLPTLNAPVTRDVVVAAVQGNVPRIGLDFNAQRRAVLDNHVRRTEQLAADVAAGRIEQPDLVLWPENSADVDPLRNQDARVAVDRAVAAIGVPVLVGAVLTPPGRSPTNTMIAWDPDGGPASDPDGVHDKRRLQPFGEYMPMREFFRLFSTLVDRSSNFVPGSGDGTVTLADVVVGVATCYEVIFDDLVRASVLSGAEMLAVPSNNATFGWTDMTFQQLGIDRVRAVEVGRAAVVPTTSGVSAVVDPDGSVRRTTEQFATAVLVEHIPLRQDLTPAVRFGDIVEWLVLGTAGVGTAASLRSQRRTRLTRRQ